MRSTGIRRKVDDLGRVVIPASIRRSLGIREGDEVEVHVDGEQVVLSRPAVRCVLCGTEDGPLLPVRERQVCRSCVASVGVLDDALRDRAREAAAAPTATGWQPPAAVVETGDVTHATTDRSPAAHHDGRTADGRGAPGETEDGADVEDLYDPASTTAW